MYDQKTCSKIPCVLTKNGNWVSPSEITVMSYNNDPQELPLESEKYGPETLNLIERFLPDIIFPIGWMSC